MSSGGLVARHVVDVGEVVDLVDEDAAGTVGPEAVDDVELELRDVAQARLQGHALKGGAGSSGRPTR